MKRYAASLLFLVLASAGVSCSKDEDSGPAGAAGSGGGVGDTDCSRIAGACHGGGPETEACHELGHSGEEAACSAKLTECLALCSGSSGAGGHGGEHHHHAGGSGGAGESTAGAGGQGGAGASETKAVTLRFAARVGDETFACGKAIEGVGSAKTTVQPLDLRFFVHDVALIRADSTEVPLTLTARHPWQSAKVALLDFEDMTGKCKGNPSTNDQVTGTLPAGDYEGVAFTIGVPASENHGDPFELGAPLTAGGMSWSWLSGFKFLKVELEQVLEPSGAGGDAPTAGLGLLHIGSTGCSGDPAKGTVTCAKANRSRVKLTGFDPTQGTITADIGKLFAETDLSQISQCHSMQGPTCTPMFAAAGLVFGTGAQAEQSVFSAK